ncbi:MAG: hypothetical protein K1V90_06485 [Muribaculaceae bacterium]
MKKTIIFAMCATLLAGCGKGSEKGGSDSDSVADEIPADVTASAGKQEACLTKDSIGAITIGMDINAVPDSVPGLYVRKVNGASPDAVTMDFEDEDGERFIAYDFGEGKIDVINLIGSDVKVKAPRGAFGIGDSFSKVLELPGVQTEWSGYDGGGMWYWRWEGLWFAPSQDNLPTVLSRRLYHSESAPTSADFTDDVTVGFIGTGLPF